MKWTIQHSVLLLSIVSVILAGTTYISYSSNQKTHVLNKSLKKELKEEKTQVTNMNANLQRLSDRYDSLYKEKNGTANEKLLQATETLFSAVYDYDTAKESSSVKSRKEALEKIAAQDVINSLFPADADKANPSVNVKSKLKNEPEVYLQSSDKNELTALVLVEYTITIEGSEDQNGSFLYKLEYDQFSNEITYLQNLNGSDLK